MATEKKNPYVMTIGFKKNNPEHIQVAEFLNSLEREKAQYIVKAVLTYRTLEEKGEVPQTGGAVSYDYETIKSIVLQIMREQGLTGRYLRCNRKQLPYRWKQSRRSRSQKKIL